MPTAPFHAVRDRVLAGNDARFAEPVSLLFLKDGRADPDRMKVEVQVILRVGKKAVSNMAGGRAESWRARFAAGGGEMFIDPTTYDGPALREKDKVVALARPGQPVFEVMSVDGRSHTRIVVRLSDTK